MFLLTATACLLALLALVGASLHVIATGRLGKHLDGSRPPTTASEPLTFWRALKPGVPNLAGKLEAVVAATRPKDQILLGADLGAASLAVCEELRARFPDREITVVGCEPNRALNPKISKFVQMTAHARHDGWLLTDSEAELNLPFVERFREEWAARGVDVLTAGYRFSGLHTWLQRLDTAPAFLTLWPGLMHAPRIDFTLGACTGVRAPAVHSLGGWASLGDQLAEDRELGARLRVTGKTLGLSRQVLTLEADDLTPWQWLKHLHRMAVTYRAATPLGTLGMPILHSLGLALLATILGTLAAGLNGLLFGLALFALTFTIRYFAARSVARHLTIPKPAIARCLLVVPLVETLCWFVAWLPLPVWWAGKWRTVGWKGKLKGQSVAQKL